MAASHEGDCSRRLQSWNSLVSLEAMLLDHNALSGLLPGTWGDLEQLQVVSLGACLLFPSPFILDACEI
jgi:hypothetical protein